MSQKQLYDKYGESEAEEMMDRGLVQVPSARASCPLHPLCIVLSILGIRFQFISRLARAPHPYPHPTHHYPPH
eukprot:3589938-Pyramimonas_sp.AAC.1